MARDARGVHLLPLPRAAGSGAGRAQAGLGGGAGGGSRRRSPLSARHAVVPMRGADGGGAAAPGAARGAGASRGLGARWETRSDLCRELRNVTPDELTAALADMLDAGTVERRVERAVTKPVEWWRMSAARSHYSHYSPDAESSASDLRENANSANRQQQAPTPLYADDEWEEWAA